MGCNCGKRRQQQYVLVRSDGSKQTFASRLEAEAANQREGGTGTVARK